ncbi:hypothetical protein BKA93DRAFT_843306 [Sparassis latifolia]
MQRMQQTRQWSPHLVPWARDEPPSPKEGEPQSVENARHTLQSRSFDITSRDSSSAAEEPGPSRWWAFTRHRPSDPLGPLAADTFRQHHTRHGREHALSIPWLNVSHYRSSPEEGPANVHGRDIEDPSTSDRHSTHNSLRLNIPTRSADPLTLAQNATPGWETPWTPRPRGDMISREHALWENSTEPPPREEHDDGEKRDTWVPRKKRFRTYLIHNTYVPLLFRFVNIVLTTAALALAIRIRVIEKRYHVMGAIGSSPTLVIIFAPLTLVHVVIAIYSEYFGRPLGLWRTSGKLLYTLVEVVFICAWSAALALCFDNFFTSLIPCASPSSTSWYNQLPRPTIPGLSSIEEGPGDTICDDQVALICLSGVGLMMYCFNLVINLFRIFERIKYHPTSIFPR